MNQPQQKPPPNRVPNHVHEKAGMLARSLMNTPVQKPKPVSQLQQKHAKYVAKKDTNVAKKATIKCYSI